MTRKTDLPVNPGGTQPRRDTLARSLLGRRDNRVLCRQVIDKIVRAVRGGAFIREAAEFAGVTSRMLNLWQARAREVTERLEAVGVTVVVDDKDDGPADVVLVASPETALHPVVDPAKIELDDYDELCLVLLAEMTRAERVAEVRLIAQWSKRAGEDWRAAAALLSKRFPDRWGNRLALTGAAGGPVEVTATVRGDVARALATDPEARRLASTLLARLATDADDPFEDEVDEDPVDEE